VSTTKSASDAPRTRVEKILDAVEAAGNKLPHPVVIFLILIGFVIVLSHVRFLLGASVTYQVYDPGLSEIRTTMAMAQSLLSTEGIRFMFTGVVSHFMGFNAVGVIIVAMVGVGVAEGAGLINALIRKLVIKAPSGALTYILVLVGILSSIARARRVSARSRGVSACATGARRLISRLRAYATSRPILCPNRKEPFHE
jgi:aminobenzoyl-glutamate transport protein